MTGILPLLFAATLALASGDSPPREEGGKKPFVGPPLRVGGFAALRSGATSAGGVELGYKVYGRDRFGLDLSGSITTPQRVSDIQPMRTFNSFSLVADGMFALSPTFTAGPSVGLSYRTYRQDWWMVQGQLMPTVGARGTAGLLTQRTWQLQLNVRGALDLMRTQLAFDTTQVQTLNPWDVQVGARLLIARQRSPLVPSEVR